MHQETEPELTQPLQVEDVLDHYEEPSKTSTRQHFLIDTHEKLDMFVDNLLHGFTVWPLVYDTETNGVFDRFGVSLVGISFAHHEYIPKEDGITPDPVGCVSYYLPMNHLTDEPQLDINYALEKLKPIFESEHIPKVCHNAKFDEMVLARHGIQVSGDGHDTYVMAWLLSEDTSSKGLKALVERHFGVEMETYEDVVAAAPKKKNVPRDFSFARVGIKEALSYAGDDAYWTYRLYEKFKAELEKQNLWVPYEKVERPFTRVLKNVEARGVYIDRPYIDLADKKLPELAEQVEAEIYAEAGQVFNPDSGKQLGDILFSKLGIGKNVPKTSTGNYSTNKKTLENYAAKHKIVENVLRRKKIKKTHSVFVDGLKAFIARDGKIHPSFNGCGTVTGRLSCRSPNLQQIEGDEVEDIRVRNFFIPTPGYRFIVADYGQVELRVMAHFSKDQKMIDAFLSGRDFHEETARGMYHVPDDKEVLPRQRFYAKAINFGIGYGRGPVSVGEQMGVSMEEAKEVIRRWHENFPQIQPYKNHVFKQARQQGYIRTLTGRKRRLPYITSDDRALRAGAERQAFSSKIQGSAADLIKLAMISLEPELAKHDAHMCIQIHDEIVMEAPEDIAEELVPVVANIMKNPVKGKNPLRLPLVVDPKVVDKWGDAK